MKILIFSDSHGSSRGIEKAVFENEDAKVILHAGDGAGDLSEFLAGGYTIYRVRGNCDYSSSLEDEEVVEIEGVKIFLTHGNAYRVSYQVDTLAKKAKAEDCSVAVFGHTHRAMIENNDGVLLINPGTINRNRSRNGQVSYAVVEIEGADVVGARIVSV